MKKGRKRLSSAGLDSESEDEWGDGKSNSPDGDPPVTDDQGDDVSDAPMLEPQVGSRKRLKRSRIVVESDSE